MKLINVDEQAPDEYFIFVNRLNPLTRNNFDLTGTFTSAAFGLCANKDFIIKYIEGTATYVPFQPYSPDCTFISPYTLKAINDYRIEYDAEYVRMQRFKTYPSRLSATFAFGDYESCELVAKQYGWDISTVKRFTLVDTPINRVARVNMEHVSLGRHAYYVSSFQSQEELWGAYWSGVGDIKIQLPSATFEQIIYSSGVVWEYLIEGCLKSVEHMHNNEL
jgi:hypothetical protein